MPSTRPASTALSGWQLFTLRPAGDAGPLLDALRRHGAAAGNLPLLRLRGASSGEAMASMRSAGGARRALFSSPTAVRHAQRIAADLQLDWFAPDGLLRRLAGAGAVFAPGPSTARALADAGIASVQVPASRLDSEGVLELPGLSAPLDGTVALVGAPGGRHLIAETLAQRGADVLDVHVYRRTVVRLGANHVDRLQQSSHPMLIASSLVALQQLPLQLSAALFERIADKAPVILASERLSRHAAELGFRRRHCAASAQVDALVAAAVLAADSAVHASAQDDCASMTT